MSSNIAEQLLSGLFQDLGIHEGKFYQLVDALKKTGYVDPQSIRISSKHSDGPFVLMAAYTGDKKIGNAAEEIGKISPQRRNDSC